MKINTAQPPLQATPFRCRTAVNVRLSSRRSPALLDGLLAPEDRPADYEIHPDRTPP